MNFLVLKMSNNVKDSYIILKDQFKNRGLKGSVLAELGNQEANEFRTKLQFPYAYIYDDIMFSPDGRSYRTGIAENGTRYMTLEDFIALREDVKVARRFQLKKLDAILKEQTDSQIITDVRPCHPYKLCDAVGIKEDIDDDDEDYRNTRGSRQIVFIGGKSVTAKDGNLAVKGGRETDMRVREAGYVAPLTRLCRACFRRDIVTTRKPRVYNQGLLAAIAISLIFLALFALPFFLKVAERGEMDKNARLTTQTRTLKHDIRQLEVELEEKNLAAGIEYQAREKYGMVEIDDSYFVMIEISPDTVETFDEQGNPLIRLTKGLFGKSTTHPLK